MAEKTINQVVAENLKYWMAQAEMTQTALGEKAGVSQKTISNYLNPDQRTEGSKGKEGSAKLGELDRVAKALGISLWQLTREMSQAERKLYENLERAYAELIKAAALTPEAPPIPPAPPAPATRKQPTLKTILPPAPLQISQKKRG